MSSPVVLDPAAIKNLRSLNPGDQDEFLREIIGIFLEDTPQRLAELDQCLAKGDASRFSRAAHSIKGSSSNLGANALRDLAGQLEHRSQKEGLADVAAQLATLKVEFDRAKVELTKLLTP
jgi:HPt (histidine-containing phosphotransfer) domain-containing protein